MKEVTPTVSIIARTVPDDDAIAVYLESAGAGEYYGSHGEFGRPEDVVEFAGKMCYRSWQPGLNPNVTKIRSDQAKYIRNILSSAHGSVLEHVSWTFVFQDVSRILTHELVRHRPGAAVSQESMRYVRLDDIPMWFPDWLNDIPGDDGELRRLLEDFVARAEWLQRTMAGKLGLDSMPFADKKRMTSFMRRFAPAGHATSMTWTANARTLRHVIETRTATGAEEEIRMVFGMVAKLMARESPLLFGDFQETDDGQWVPEWSKV